MIATDTKACPVLSCRERVDYDHFACKEHWYELPPNLRSKVYHAYNHYKKTGDMRRYAEGSKLCFEWYREHGHGLR